MSQAVERIETAIDDRRATAAALSAAMSDLIGAPATAPPGLIDQVRLWFRAADAERARRLTASALADRAGATRRRAS